MGDIQLHLNEAPIVVKGLQVTDEIEAKHLFVLSHAALHLPQLGIHVRRLDHAISIVGKCRNRTSRLIFLRILDQSEWRCILSARIAFRDLGHFLIRGLEHREGVTHECEYKEIRQRKTGTLEI